MSSKVSLKEFKEKVIDMIYEILEEELNKSENEDSEENNQEKVQKAFISVKNTGDNVYGDYVKKPTVDHDLPEENPLYKRMPVYQRDREI